MRVIKLMADYYCFPLWEASPGEVGNISPDSLPISNNLKKRLADWAAAYDKTLDEEYPPNSGFKSEKEELEFNKEAVSIADELRRELGGVYSVIVHCCFVICAG